jgi:hypothetical protein
MWGDFMKRVVTVAAIVLLALALLAGGRPAISEAATTHTIAVFGDPQEADAKLTTPDLSPGFQFIVPFLAQTGADAAIGLGDYARVENFTQTQTDERYNTFLYEYGKTNIPFSSSVWVQGNHDAVSTMDRTEWATYFKQPADLHAWGLYQIDGIYVIQLQSWAPGYDAYIGYYGEGDSGNSPQANWLVATLQSLPRDAWVVVADHIPVADTAVNTSPGAEAESPLLLALFAKYGVDLVLGGHDHDYRRHMGPNGVPYITDGMAGGPAVATNFVPIDPHDLVVFSGLAAAPSDDHFGYLTIQFDGATMHVTAYEGQLDVPPMQAFDSFPVSNQESSVPTVSGFVPTSGVVGSTVTLNGAGFSTATKITFNDVAAKFTVNSDTQITATVPSGATSGKIAVTTPAGTATSAANFTVIPIPKLTSFTPTSGAVASSVTLTGSGFSGASKVTFNGLAAKFTVVSATKITATVPATASSGKIAVTTPGGTATSATSFTVKPTLTLALSGLTGGAITLGKSVIFKGAVTPTNLAGSKVTLTVQRKSGTSWVAVTKLTATIASGGTYSSTTYKPTVKVVFRVQAAIAATTGHAAATTAWRTFTVK